MRVMAWVLLLAMWAGPALALDPGTSAGRYERDGVRIDFSHAIALSQDNAEGMLDHPNQMRVLLSDKEIPAAALEGLAFPPVRAMARAGEIRGLLLEFDPADRTTLQVSVLAKPEDPNAFLPNLSLSNSEGLWKRLEANPTQVTGEYKPDDDNGLAFSFSAPVFTNAVTADLKGAEAQKSDQVRVLVARAEAIGRGDLPATLALTAKSAQGELRGLPPGAFKQAAAEMPGLIKALKSAKRVVVRRETAAVMVEEGSWSSLVLEDGAWKVAD
jgi:hypothetical protein